MNAPALYIDIGTFTNLESKFYGGPESITWFVRTIQKSNWFGIMLVSLRANGTCDFNSKNVSVVLPRGIGDYLINMYVKVELPQIMIRNDPTIFSNSTIRWTKNIMHNLLPNIRFCIGEIAIQTFDTFTLDMLANYNISSNLFPLYDKMIGNIKSLTTPVNKGEMLGKTSTELYLTIPFWFSVDSGFALPLTSIPLTELKILIDIADWRELVIVNPGTKTESAATSEVRGATTSDIVSSDGVTKPSLNVFEVWSHTIVLHDDERNKLGESEKYIKLTQYQSRQPIQLNVTSETQDEIRFNNAITFLAFAGRNTTIEKLNNGLFGKEGSNYTSEFGYSGADSLSNFTLEYESFKRIDMPSSYFSNISPYYFTDGDNGGVGYHIFSYSLNPFKLDIMGSTNFGKIGHIKMITSMSQESKNAIGSNPTNCSNKLIVYPNANGLYATAPQSYELGIVAAGVTIAVISNGMISYAYN